MLSSILKDYNIILASGSPRRQELLKGMDIEFNIQLKPIAEHYPDHLKRDQITSYLAKLKSKPFEDVLQPKDILITSDTIVWFNDNALGKPKDETDAFNMISSLSAKMHEVYSSVCFTSTAKQKVVTSLTKVTFNELTEEDIWYYIETFKPFDKAGAYGIQDWIGKIAVSNIEGSYFNVMGFPTHLVHNALKNFVAE